jgi:hypothetical protein
MNSQQKRRKRKIIEGFPLCQACSEKRTMHNALVHANLSMKTFTMLRRVLTAFGFVAVLALRPAPARAQTAEAPPAKEDQPAAPPSRPDRFDPRAPRDPRQAQPFGQVHYDLEIERGTLKSPSPGNPNGMAPATLENVVKLLRDKHPEANIAMAPGVENVQINDLKIHAAELGEELEALRVASGGDFIFLAKAIFNTNRPFFTIEASEKYLNERPQFGLQKRQVEVFNFSSYLTRHRNSQPMDDSQFSDFKDRMVEMTKEIVVKTAQSLNLDAGSLQFQFHGGANLLVVTGVPEAINVARKVISAMLEQPSGDADSPAIERMFSVLGQVTRPGRFAFPQNGSVNLLEAIAQAGGYTRLGAPSKVDVRRIENGVDKIYHLDADKMASDPSQKQFEIKPGDNITVRERNFNN